MEQKLFIIGFACDIILMSLFLWHMFVRMPKINKEVHTIMNKIKNCPNNKQLKRLK